MGCFFIRNTMAKNETAYTKPSAIPTFFVLPGIVLYDQTTTAYDEVTIDYDDISPSKPKDLFTKVVKPETSYT